LVLISLIRKDLAGSNLNITGKAKTQIISGSLIYLIIFIIFYKVSIAFLAIDFFSRHNNLCGTLFANFK